MVIIAAYRGDREKEKDQVLETAIDSFKQLVRKLKTKPVVKKPIAYFYGIMEKKFDEIYFEELWEMVFRLKGQV